MKKNIVYKIPEYSELKKMNISELKIVAELVRKRIIEISKNKNTHLSSNLGIVELSLSLLYVFDSPKDQIVYDTGHQSYVHKILTDRNNLINTIRDDNGLSGFQNPLESDHDLISSGHSGNILSICQGYIENMENKDNFIVPVVGDGAISNGLTFEALNNISYNKTPILIIINDNGMSISKNVGGMHKMMSKIQMSKSIYVLEKFLRKILFKRKWSEKIYWFIYNVFASVSTFFKGKNFFEKLGFHYFGVVDGNNIKKTTHVLKRVKNLVKFGPVILHVKTIKGYGLKEAELDDNGIFHSYQLNKNNNNITKSTTYGEVAANILDILISYDKNIRIINPAMTLSTNFLNLSLKYPNNYEDVGIAEEHAISKSTGMLLADKKVFISIYSTFLQRGYDNVLHDIARLKLPAVFLIDRADISYSDGDTHHGIYDVGFLKSIPNTIICSPSNKEELEQLIIMGYENKTNPMFIRYSKDKCESVTDSKKLAFGSWVYVVKKKEAKTLIVSYGDIINDLKNSIGSKELDLINAIFITGYNKEQLEKIFSKYKKIYVVEKVYDSNCLGDDLINYAYVNKKDCIIEKINIKTNDIGFGSRKIIDKKLGIDTDSIFEKIIY